MKFLLFAFLSMEIYSTLCKTCPEGWIEVEELGCLHFGSEATTWFGASSYCEEIHPNSSMIEIHSQEENDLVSLVGNVLVTVTDVDRWWIGLEDIGHEGIWEWQPSSSIASYFSWGYEKPSPDTVNMNDCVYMSPNPLANDFVWTDFYCEALDNTTKIAPLCQIRKETSTTTEVPTSTTTTEILSTTSEALTTTPPRLCPESYDEWEWVPFGGNCYKYVNNSAQFYVAKSYCRDSENNGDLISIQSPEENAFIGKLYEENGNRHGVLLGGFVENDEELCDENDDKWSWSDGTPWNYTHWYPGKPTCSHYSDNFCVYMYNSEFGFRWNNVLCSREFQFVCKV